MSTAARLRDYVSDHKTDFDLYVQTLTYAYNNKTHKTTGKFPFYLPLTRHPPSSIIMTTSTANTTNIIGPQSTRELRMGVLDC